MATECLHVRHHQKKFASGETVEATDRLTLKRTKSKQKIMKDLL